MPRAARVDREATKAKQYFDSRSFVSTHGDEYLKGMDLGQRRREVYDRSKGRCQLQNSPRCRGWISWETMEMDHIQGGLVGRNDNLENLRAVCAPCHRHRHVQVRWSSGDATKIKQEREHHESD